jgi:hypothetical protein
MASSAIVAIVKHVLGMDQQIFDKHMAAILIHAVARSRVDTGPLAHHLLGDLTTWAPTDMASEDAVLLLYALSIDTSISCDAKLVSWLMRSCLESGVGALAPASAAIAVNAIGKLWLRGALEGDAQGGAAAGTPGTIMIGQLAERLAKAPLSTLDPRSIANAVNGFSIVWQGEVPSTVFPANSRLSASALAQKSEDSAATFGKGPKQQQAENKLLKRMWRPGSATLRRELSLRTIPMYEVQMDALNELALRDEVYSVLASATMAHTAASLSQHGSSVIANLASSFSKQNWGEGKRGIGVTRPTLARHLASAYVLTRRRDFNLNDVLPLVKAVLALVKSDKDILAPVPFDTVGFVRQVGTRVCEALENTAKEEHIPLHTYASMIHTLAGAGLDITDDVFTRIIRAMARITDSLQTSPHAFSPESLSFAISAVGRVAGDEARILCVRLCSALVKNGYDNVDLKMAANAVKGLADTWTRSARGGGREDGTVNLMMHGEEVRGQSAHAHDDASRYDTDSGNDQGSEKSSRPQGDLVCRVHEDLVAWVGNMPERDLFVGGSEGTKLLVDIAMGCKKMGVGAQLRDKIMIGLVYSSRYVRVT